jgi:hypothetical protein
VLRKADPAKADPTSETLEIEPANHVWQSLAFAPAALQAKLAVSRPDDQDEQEADQIAAHVMQMTEAQASSSLQARMSEARDDEEKTRGTKGQRTDPQYALRDPLITNAQPSSRGKPLDSATRNFFEPRFGENFSDVRVHTDRHAAQQAEALRSNAFTVGSNIVFNADRFQPNLSSGRWLLGHELAHVVQQRPGYGSATSPRPLIQRDRFQRGPAEAPRTPAQIRALKLSEFEALATAQLDWATSPHLIAPAAAADLAAFRQILDFYREPDMASTCSDMLVSDVITQGVPGTFPPLRIYTRGASPNRDTAWLRITDVVATAVAWANDLASLEAASDRGTLRVSMPAANPIDDPVGAPSPFELLENAHYIADFLNYLNLVHPVLSATDGWEVVSYVALRRLVDPVTYLGRINYVRDYHHFTYEALEGLVRNEAVPLSAQQDFWTQRPLTLVLHTTMDHNHAFHQTIGMTELIVRTDILTIVIEGYPTLADYRAQILLIAPRYGIDGRIEQVLIAGHGEFNRVGMAGTVVGGVRQQEKLTNAGTAGQIAATEDLVRTLVAAMDADPARRRIVLAACLTASHSVTAPLDPNDPAAASATITNAINANPNIRDFIQNLAGVGSTVIGIRASQPADTFLDPGGQLALNIADDPHIMGSIVEYIEFGTEPEGALRAVVEGWAADNATNPPGTLAFDAMNRRIHRPITGTVFSREIIFGIYERVVNHHWANGDMINRFTSLAGLLDELYWDEVDQAASLWAAVRNFPAADIDGIFNRMTASHIWSDDKRLRMVMYQSWMRHIPARSADFLRELATFANCGLALHSVDIGVVRPMLPGLLTIPAPAAPDPGQLRLALIAAALHPLPLPAPVILPPETQFLRGLLGAGPNFPAALNIPALTTGLTSENGIITAIGRGQAAPPPGRATPQADLPHANVDLDRDGTNDFYLEPLTRSGTVANCYALFIRSRPWMGDNIRDAISVGTAVRVIGRSHGWYGIEWQGRIRFVYSTYIQLAP